MISYLQFNAFMIQHNTRSSSVIRYEMSANLII